MYQLILIFLVFGLVIVGLLPVWVGETAATAVAWSISAISFALAGISIATAIVNRRSPVGTPTHLLPAFVLLALIFVLYATLNSFLHLSSFDEASRGFKRYFQAMGIMLALTWLPVSEEKIQRLLKLFLVIALLQLPFAIYQLIVLVPIREVIAFSYPGLVPVDVVAGTFGMSLTQGGLNGEMVTFLIMVLAFLLSRRREKCIGFTQTTWIAFFILAPLFLGETKIVLILLPLMFIILYRREFLMRPHLALAGVMTGILLTLSAGYVYVIANDKPLNELMENTLEYNLGDMGYGQFYLNRITVLSFWGEQQGFNNPASALTGYGLGAAHDGTDGHIALRYPGYGISLTAASTLLWEQGILGTTLFLAILVSAWRAAGRIQRIHLTPSWIRADAAAIQAVLPLFAVHLVYRSMLLQGLPFQIVFWSVLGYLAWMVRRYRPGVTV